MAKRAGSIALLFVGGLLVGACSGGDDDRRAADSKAPSAASSTDIETPSPASSKRKGLCQPFPDRLIDEFIAAYNGRDLEALENLVTAPRIEDVVAAAHAGESSYGDVREWAEVNWDADDRIESAGYSAFYPTKRGFQMLITRHSATLRANGIERVSTTFDAISDGCTIASLSDSGPVQAKGRPCAFYDAFGDFADVASDEPGACVDGSGDHARTGALAVFTRDRMIVWGGGRGGHFTYGDVAMDGFAFGPKTGRWARVPPPDLPDFSPAVGAWTGTEFIVVGTKTRHNGVVGAAYDPIRGSWRTIKFPYGSWSGFEGVWTGSELILWGGPDHSSRPRRRGAVYEPASGTWHRTSPAPIGGRWGHAVAWTGSEMVVWGGTDARGDRSDGAAYDPGTDSWRKITPAPISARQWMPLAWTGAELVVWGGSSYSTSRADGAAYDPGTDTWQKLPAAPIKGRHYHSVTWTGEEIVVFGGYSFHRSFADGAAYDPVRNRWRKLPRAPIKPRFQHSAIWTGTGMIVFGGTWDFGHIALGDGAIYDPESNQWKRLVPDLGKEPVSK
jgi:N-acetylneuraminic acid mutarotase